MIRVLLVDDEEDALDLLEILLHQTGEVEVAGRYANPVQAVEALRASEVDAVFLDNEMPGMMGMETARRMRAIRPDLQIVFTTAHAEYAVEAFEVQSVDYLLKPLTLPRLRMAVSRLRTAESRDGMRGTLKRPDVSIRCMGGFSIALPDEDGRFLPWKTTKQKELCAFLIHHGEKRVDTPLILEDVWPGYDLNKAKTYLYTCLSYLRKSFQEHDLPLSVEKSGDGFSIRLNGTATDARLLEDLLDGMLSAERPDTLMYDKINRLYKGEYMEGCDYRWAVFRQETIKTKYIRVLRGMYPDFRRRGDRLLAEDCLRRVLAVAPDSEADGRELIRLHLEAGNRSEALRVYRQLERVMHELGIGLEEETVELYKKMGRSG